MSFKYEYVAIKTSPFGLLTNCGPCYNRPGKGGWGGNGGGDTSVIIDEIDNVRASIEEFKGAQASEFQAVALKYTKMRTEFYDTYGEINETFQLISDANGTTAESILELIAATEESRADLVTTNKAVANHTGALASIENRLDVEFIPRFGVVESSIQDFKEVQASENLATALSMERLDSKVNDNEASILEEKTTRADQYSSMSEILTEIRSSTENNAANIISNDQTYTDRFTANASRMSEIEAETESNSGKITNLEEVTADINGVVVSQGSTLSARIDGIAIGGRNLLRNADFKLGVDAWGFSSITDSEDTLGNLLTVINTGTSADPFGLKPLSIYETITLIEGREYVLSFYANGNIDKLNNIEITNNEGRSQKLNDAPITRILNDRTEIVFTAEFTTETGSVLIGTMGYPKDYWFNIVAVKLEQGNIASDWTMAPEDAGGAAVNEVSANIEEFKRVQALENEATATRFVEMDTQYGEAFGSINERYDLISNELGTTAEAILELESTTGTNSASITELKGTTSTNSGSIASMNSKLEVEYIPKVEHIEANIKNAVKQTDVEYYLSTSASRPEGGEWLTTAPPWTPSMYMFQRIKTTYVDDLVKYTPSDLGTNITGAKGADGKDGVNGLEGPKGDKGIPGDKGEDGKSSYTHLAYATSSLGANFSTSHFTTATYIGMYVDDEEVDSEERTDYKWSLIKGADGTKGTPGAKGADGLTPYFHVAYATNATGTTGFSTEVSAGKTYLGQYTDNTLEDSEDPKKYKWTLIKGATGSTGSVGQGVDKIVEQYAVSTSKTEVPTSWGTTMPEWSYGLYVWTRSQITYKNPKEVAYTQALVDSSWEAVNNLEIGGRNLAINTGLGDWDTYGSGVNITTSTGSDGNKITKVVQTSTATGGIQQSTSDRKMTLEENGEYILSFDLRSNIAYSSTILNYVYLMNASGGNQSVSISRVSLSPTRFTRVSASFTKSGTSPTSYVMLSSRNAKVNDWFEVKNVKVEKGNKATDWSPAPEDVSEAIQGSIDIGNAITSEFGKLKAETKVLTEIGGKISGWKNYNNGTTSSFDILADKFSVGTATTMVKPFSISGNDIVFNGKVSFNSVTGTVSSSQIPNGTINLNHMVTADKNKINTASTTAASALANAATAQTKANQAATAASTADGKAVTAQSTADTLKNNIYYPNTTTIDGGKIRTGSITAASGAIGNLAVTTAKLANLAVTTGKIANLAVDTAQIANGAIETAKIGNAQVDTLQIKGQAVTVPRLTYIGTPKIIVRDGVAQSGTTYSAIGNVPNPPFTPDSYTYDKWVFEVARTSFDPQGGSVSIELGVDGLHISKLKRVGAHFAQSPFFFELQVRRLGTTNPLRVKREFRPNFTLNTAVIANEGIPPFDIRLPTILDTPNKSLGTVTYVAEFVFYAHRSTHATTRDFKRATEHEVGFSAAFCQILGVKR